MKTLEEFFSERKGRGSAYPPVSGSQRGRSSALGEEVHETANRGLAIFPVPELAKLTAQHDLLIGEATCDFSRLEELVLTYHECGWRAAVGSKFCVVRLIGLEGRAWFAAKCQDQGDCLTLTAVRGDTVWAIFHWPKRLVLHASAKKLVPGVEILADGDSFPVPPSGGCTWANPWAEIEAMPYWLRELAFDAPDSPPGRAVPTPTPYPRPAPCRSTTRFEKQHRSVKKGHPTCDQVGWRSGFRVSRRR